MPRTTTRFVDFERLRMRGSSAAVVIKLMMAANDMSYANQSLGDYKAAVERGDRGVRRNGGLYWVRLQIAHMSEAFHIIRQIHDDETLMMVVRSCDMRTRDSFEKLLPFLHGGPRYQEFVQLVEKVRSKQRFRRRRRGRLEVGVGAQSGDPGIRRSIACRGAGHESHARQRLDANGRAACDDGARIGPDHQRRRAGRCQAQLSFHDDDGRCAESLQRQVHR